MMQTVSDRCWGEEPTDSVEILINLLMNLFRMHAYVLSILSSLKVIQIVKH